MAELRILPLLSSATEIVHALGLGQFQVGRSHECDYPPSVLSLPICSSPAIAVDGSSAEIDAQVKQRLTDALSIYNVDSKQIAELNPTHIITQTQCKVCAVSLEDVELALQKQTGTQAKVISLEPYALNDLWADILRVGSALGFEERARQLNAELQNRMSAIAERATKATWRPRVAAIEWLDPLMAAGNWVPELIWIASGDSVFGEAGQHSPWMKWENLVREDPDLIVALPCGFDLARTRAEMRWLTERSGWSDLKAVKTGRVYLCDGNQFMNRPGPRLVESLQIFGEIFHPELFEPELQGIGWEKIL
jgi:iron complex transport system substrate-binding protein